MFNRVDLKINCLTGQSNQPARHNHCRPNDERLLAYSDIRSSNSFQIEVSPGATKQEFLNVEIYELQLGQVCLAPVCRSLSK